MTTIYRSKVFSENPTSVAIIVEGSDIQDIIRDKLILKYNSVENKIRINEINQYARGKEILFTRPMTT